MAGELDERTEILASQIESLGHRALSTAHTFAAAIRLAPALAVKKAMVEYVWEELKRFESASDLYVELVPGADLHAAVQRRVGELPVPASWLEMTVVQFLYDRAGKVQLRESLASGEPRLARLARGILEGERMHTLLGGEGGNALRNLLVVEPEQVAEAQACFDRWLAISLRSFGRPGSARGRRAIELGLKRRDSAPVIREYLEELEPIRAACGLRLPARKSLGLELPDGLGLA